jgi:preprotein translocase subunit SecA
VELERPQLTADFVADAQSAYDERETALGEERMRHAERYVLLTVLDRKWREHLYEMDYLREGIGLRSMASRDPLVEYQREGAGMFAAMMDSVMEEVVQFLFHLEPPQVTVTAAPVPAQESKGGRRPARRGAAPKAAAAAEPPDGEDQAAPPDGQPASRQRSALEAEAAAARSEFNLTAKGLASAPPSSTHSAAPARPLAAKTEPADLRANRPGAAGRRNQGKKKRR